MSSIIESSLLTWFATHRSKNYPKVFLDAAEYSVFSGGKRIRPRLMLASAQALGISIDRIIPFAVAIELYHTFSLIHDDLPGMDNDDWRRGVPTLHRRFGEAQAILVGDWLLHESLSLVYRHSPSQALVRCFEESTGPLGVIGGQSLELTLPQPNDSERNQIHDLKTAALFRFSVAAPSFMNLELSTEFTPALLDFGTKLGLAFQAADDLEDRLSTSTEVIQTIKHFSQSLESYETWFNNPIWPGDVTELRAACREVVNKLRSAQ